MQTECSARQYEFEGFDGRQVVADFAGGDMTSNAGALLLGTVDGGLGLIRRFAACFSDRRNLRYVEHQLETMIGQRVFALALGYEDVNDHDELRKDPTFAVLARKLEPVLRKDCEALAGKSTLNRLELAKQASKYHKITVDPRKVEPLFVDLFVEAHARAPKRIVIDLDATDIPLHGHQEGRFFHGYYDVHCYLPLYIFCGKHLLAAKMRRSNIDASAGTVAEIARIVNHIRKRWAKTQIILRADSGFARDELMAWCETNRVEFLFGLARNARLVTEIEAELAVAATACRETGKPARRFKDFMWTTLDSWSRRRRVVGKAEHTLQGSNPRFVVTSLARSEHAARPLYEKLYCARGEAENRIGEQFELFADRASAATMAANQLRLWFSAMAYTLVATLRRVGLKHTQLANAAVHTIRLKLFKLGAQVRRSVRRIHFAIASGCPNKTEFEMAFLHLNRAFAKT